VTIVAMEQGATGSLRRGSKSPDLVHLGYSMHVAAANGDKRRVKRCLKAGTLSKFSSFFDIFMISCFKL